MLLPLYGEFLSQSVMWLVLSCPVTFSERPFLITQHIFALHPNLALSLYPVYLLHIFVTLR